MPKHKMTVEEAAERILRGEPFLPCTKCGGLGYERKGEIAPGQRNIEICTDCLLTGVVVEKTYRLACKRLKRPLPDKPKLFSGPNGYKTIQDLATLSNKAVFVKYAEEDAAFTQRLMTELRLHPPLDES